MRFWKRMKRGLKCWAIWTAALGMVGPWSTVQATCAAANGSAATITDVELGTGGTLDGQISAVEDEPRTERLVTISRGDEVIAETLSDADGRFRVTGLKGGIYFVSSDGIGKYVRLWTADSAPPIAATNLELLQGDHVVRGQGCTDGASCTSSGSRCRPLLPWIIAGGVAAAIAIPLALDDDDGS